MAEDPWKYAKLSREQFGSLPGTYWHGAPDGERDMSRATKGIHVGTRQAATEALNARIGTPHEGSWDSTREYGKTLLGPGERTGYSCHEFPGGAGRDDTPKLPSGRAQYGSGHPVPLTVHPDILPVRIVGKMTNAPYAPHDDFKANGYMSAALKRGHAKSGYYYRNVGEDAGSISAVVPSRAHLKTHDDYVREAMPFHEPAVFHDRRG